MSTAVVVNLAAPLGAVEELVARRVVATVVAARPDVEVLAAVPPQGAAWTLGLDATTFPATPHRPHRARVLASVLRPGPGRRSCRCDPVEVTPTWALEEEYLRALGGSSPVLVDHLRRHQYESTLFVGLTATTVDAVPAVASSQAVLLPLGPLGDDLGQLPRAASAVRAAGAVVVLDDEQAAAVDAFGGRGRAVNVPLRVDGGALRGRPRGVPDRPYVLLLTPWDGGPAWRREAARLARVLAPDVETVVLTADFIYPDDWPVPLLVRPGGSRSDVWRWMHGAVAVVDLRPDPLLPRDAVEAMLCGVPVIVPAETRAAAYAERSGGGIWYRTATDIAVAVRHLLRDEARSAIGDAGRRWAEARFEGSDFAASMEGLLAPVRST